MLSQIGCVTLPPATVEKLYKSHSLSPAEQEMVDRMPAFVDKCLANIPRIEPVREILRLYPRQFNNGANNSAAGPASELPWGARALRLALDLDSLESGENRADYPLAIRRGRTDCYDAFILDAFAKLRGDSQHVRMLELQIKDLRIGMVFGEDLKSGSGVLLVARGQEVTTGLLERLRNFPADVANRQVVRMISQKAPAHPVPAGAVR